MPMWQTWMVPHPRAAANLFAVNESPLQRTVAGNRSLQRGCRTPGKSIRWEAMPPFTSKRVIAAGAGVAAVLALSIAAQTYLSMLGHGHSFRRMLAWQLTTWAFWACAAPLVLRRGAEFMARRPRALADVVPLVWLGTLLLTVHSVLSAQLTMWIQPFVPVETYTLVQAWAAQLPVRF